MHSRLVDILDEKKNEVAKLKQNGLPVETPAIGLAIRRFKDALLTPDKIDLIAEIKFASPSAGVIRTGSDPLAIGRMYEASGASAISLLTDKPFFGGSLGKMIPLKKAVTIPILRKDFIIDEIQVRESLLFGADAILLIVRILSAQQLMELLSAAYESGLAVLTEIHDPWELDIALNCGAEIIGINNRNLDTFEVDLNTTRKIAPLIPKGRVKVSESGIFGRGDILWIKECGVHAALVGTAIMKAENPAEKLKELAAA